MTEASIEFKGSDWCLCNSQILGIEYVHAQSQLGLQSISLILLLHTPCICMKLGEAYALHLAFSPRLDAWVSCPASCGPWNLPGSRLHHTVAAKLQNRPALAASLPLHPCSWLLGLPDLPLLQDIVINMVTVTVVTFCTAPQYASLPPHGLRGCLVSRGSFSCNT